MTIRFPTPLFRPTTDGGASNGVSLTWSNALTTTNDIVLEQKLFTYDQNSNLIETTDRQRFHSDPTDSNGEGNLDGPGSADGKASRDYYSGSYYDAADRLTDSVNVGTNGGTAWAMPAAVPTGSDTVLVNHTDYDLGGRVVDTVDPRGVKSGTFYDMLGRAIEVIGAWDGSQNPSAGNSTNQITTYKYNGNSNVISMTAEQPTTGGGTPSQTTDYIYGIGSTGNLFSNDLIGTIEYPDKTSGAAATVASEQQSFGYNFQGEKTSFTDQNGTTHQYNIDVLGRLTADIITQFGSGVDQSVKSLGYNFNDAGLPFQQTSYNDTVPNGTGNDIVNQVQDAYNGYQQLTAQYQSASGAVIVATTPVVQYGYSSGDNNSRLATMTYPNGRVLDYVYASGLDSAISRVSALSDAGGSEQGFDVRYAYLGLSTIVQEAYGSSTTVPQLDYVKLSNEPTGDAGDQYTGLDRFGRVADQRWLEVHGGVPPVISTLDERQYGYDRNSNVLYMGNLVAPSFSELYHANSQSPGDDNTAYDPLNRLQVFQRGTLSASNNNGGVLDTVSALNTLADSTENYSLDALGNTTAQTIDNGTPTNRSLNAQNQITADGSNSLSYDNNGNMTTDEQGFHYFWDAWNRLMQVKDQTNTVVKDTIAYNALGWAAYENNGANNYCFYASDGRMVQSQFTTTQVQYVWGINGPTDLILRDRNADQNTGTGSLGLTGSGLEEREYVMHDANGDVIGLLNTGGTVTERFAYSPYVGSSRVDLQACKLEYSIVSPK